MRKFFLWLLICTVAIGGITWLGSRSAYFSHPSFFFQILVFLLFSTSLLFVYLYRATNPMFFLQLYLLTMVLKLIAYLAFNVVMVLHDKPGAAVNVIFFLTVYFIFTALEIGFLFHKINRRQGP